MKRYTNPTTSFDGACHGCGWRLMQTSVGQRYAYCEGCDPEGKREALLAVNQIVWDARPIRGGYNFAVITPTGAAIARYRHLQDAHASYPDAPYPTYPIEDHPRSSPMSKTAEKQDLITGKVWASDISRSPAPLITRNVCFMVPRDTPYTDIVDEAHERAFFNPDPGIDWLIDGEDLTVTER